MTGFAKKCREWLGRDEALRSKSHRIVFMVCAVCLSLYLAYVLFLAGSPVFAGVWETVYSLVWFFVYAAGIYGVLLGSARVLSRSQHRKTAPYRAKHSLAFWAMSVGVSLLVLGVSFAACYPGAVTYDIYNQWTQVITGQYNGWHPVFHTLMIWLASRVSGSYPWMVALQLLCFALALAYLLSVLQGFGLKKGWLLLVQALILTSPLVNSVLMGIGKDNAMTLGAMLLCAQSIRLYATRGEWIRRPLNIAALGATLAWTTLARHNGMFFSVPLMLCLLLCYGRQRKPLAMAAALMAVLVALVLGPLYGALDVVKPNNTLEESVGIPMTILCDARKQNPETLDPETAAFLEKLMPQEAFEEKYVLHQYNSVKFTWPREYIALESPKRLLSMTMNTIRRNPQRAFATFNAVTGLVWDVTGKNEGVDAARNSGDLKEYPFPNSRLNQLGKALKDLIEIPFRLPPIAWLCQNIGVQVALLLLCGLWALYRSGLGALPLCLPVLIYNLGTALLLCGNDARFFQFSLVICLPSVLALWQQPEEASVPPI